MLARIRQGCQRAVVKDRLFGYACRMKSAGKLSGKSGKGGSRKAYAALPAKTVTIAVCVAAAVLFAVFAAAWYLVSFALDTRSRHGSPSEEISPEKTALWDSLAPLGQPVSVTADDGLILHGTLFTPAGRNAPGGRWVIAVHGYKSLPASMAPLAARYLEKGWTVLVPEQRSHGKSAGRYIGMGFFEKNDLVRWTEFAAARDPAARILLHGVSMGASTVMLASALDLPDNVAAAVEDCGYSSLTGEFTAQLADMFSLPAFPLIPAASLVCRLRAGFFFRDVDCTAAVASSSIPVLFIHGEADRFVPFWMLDKLYAAAACGKARLTVPGAEHAMSEETDPQQYWAAVDAFTACYFR